MPDDGNPLDGGTIGGNPGAGPSPGGGGPIPGGGGGGGEAAGGTADQGPPGGGATEWRARALQAQARADELEQALAAATAQAQAAHAMLESLKRRREVESALIEAGAVDVETAFLVVEERLKASPDESVSEVVAEVASKKPFLFAGGGPRGSGGPLAMSAAGGGAPGGSLEDAWESARRAGNRRGVLGYLRAKRGV